MHHTSSSHTVIAVMFMMIFHTKYTKAVTIVNNVHYRVDLM